MRASRLVAPRRRLMCSLIFLASVAGVTSDGTAASASPPRHNTALDAPTCSSTTPISAGPSPLAGAIANPSAPPQCFTFEDNGGDTLFIHTVATSTNPSPTVEVIDPEGNPLPSGVTDTTGTYTIEVSDTSAGPFDIVLQQMDNPVGCTTVPLGKPAVSSVIADPGEFWCLQFELTDTQFVTTSLSAAPGPMDELFYGPTGASSGGFFGVGVGGADGGLYHHGLGVQTLMIAADGESPATGAVTITLGELDLFGNPSGPAGTELQVFGAGFRVNEGFKVTYRTGLSSPTQLVICQGRVPRSRQPECLARIPGKAEAGALGPHEIVMTGLSSGHVAKVSFALT